MRRDGAEGPERPHGRRQPKKEESGFLWPPTAGERALCILLFILFFAFSWGAWSSGTRSSSTPRTPRRKRSTPSSPARAGWRSPPRCWRWRRSISGKASSSRRNSSPDAGPRPEATPRKHGEALDFLEIHVACHGDGNNRLDDQLAAPGFPDIDDPGMGPLVRVGRGGGPWPEHSGGAGGNSQAPRLVAGDAYSRAGLADRKLGTRRHGDKLDLTGTWPP